MRITERLNRVSKKIGDSLETGFERILSSKRLERIEEAMIGKDFEASASYLAREKEKEEKAKKATVVK